MAKLSGACMTPSLRAGVGSWVHVAPEFPDQNSPVTWRVFRLTTPAAMAPPGPVAIFMTVCVAASIVPPLCAAPNVWAQVAPLSLLTEIAVDKLPAAEALGAVTAAYSRFGLLGSPPSELTGPFGRPVPAAPEIWVKPAPPSVLRYKAPTCLSKGNPEISYVAANITLPRAATPTTL